MSALKVGSLCSGVGGFELGLEPEGFEISWQCEIDPYRRTILNIDWPEVFCYRDITVMDFTAAERVEMICGGFPCQPFSSAGLKRGCEDDRYLWPHILRAVRDIRPEIVLLENVPGIRWVNDGREFGRIFGDLAEVGYDAEWDSLPAAAFGSPQLRDRVFIISYPSESGRDERPRFFWKERRVEPAVRSEHGASTEEETISDTYPEGRERAIREAVARAREGRQDANAVGPDWWPPEPPVCRVANGVPAQSHRLSALGESVVPRVIRFIGRRIMAEGKKLRPHVKTKSDKTALEFTLK